MGRKLSREPIFYTYALLDPRRGPWCGGGVLFGAEPFYIGKGHGKRSQLTIYKASAPRAQRIGELRSAGLRPIVVILSAGLIEHEALAQERELIAIVRRAPHGPLLNVTGGGQGMAGYSPPPETRAKLSAAQKGKYVPPHVGAQISATKRANPRPSPYKGVPRSPDVVAKISAAQKGKPRLYLMGRSPSPETRAKIAASNTGKVHSAEARAKMSASKSGKANLKQRGVPKAPHVIAALRAGYASTPNIGAKISEGKRKARLAKLAEQS